MQPSVYFVSELLVPVCRGPPPHCTTAASSDTPTYAATAAGQINIDERRTSRHRLKTHIRCCRLTVGDISVPFESIGTTSAQRCFAPRLATWLPGCLAARLPSCQVAQPHGPSGAHLWVRGQAKSGRLEDAAMTYARNYSACRNALWGRPFPRLSPEEYIQGRRLIAAGQRQAPGAGRVRAVRLAGAPTIESRVALLIKSSQMN
ncbi:hypothetical protein RR46_04067 [Papilio xuthus]|uniref:Uncharacterized protein n=1 Tax=Papilio xuthus TaxID=66420 RepID=A0A194QN89_PAPXU|nr:hypothetical protein RR46_04067 [Papilio xuthus]